MNARTSLVIFAFAGGLLRPTFAADLPQWDLAALARPPAVVAAQEVKVAGLQSVYVEALPYRGRPTRFYAYFGLPPATGKVPAVVLVHGGGGTAYAGWVKYWNDKGYAALSIDTEGQIPAKIAQPRPHWQTVDSLHLPWAGGPQRDAAFGDHQLPVEQQWMYHAVADSILSVSFLASRPEIDASRIGIVGISWGSLVCSIAGGVDPRLAFVVPQYIGGDLKLGNSWHAYMTKNPDTFRWNPANFYPGAKSKTRWLWINDLNDRYGLPPMITAAWRSTGPDSWMTVLPALKHDHFWGETGPNAVREIYAFADSVTKGSAFLTRIVSATAGHNEATLVWKSASPVVRAQICYTTDPIPLLTFDSGTRKDWANVRYKVETIALPPRTRVVPGTEQAIFPLPAGIQAGFINLIDARGLTVSGDFWDLER